jgi:hypothetical protein
MVVVVMIGVIDRDAFALRREGCGRSSRVDRSFRGILQIVVIIPEIYAQVLSR